MREDVVKRMRDNLSWYRGIQEPLNALLYQLTDAYSKLRLVDDEPRSKCQQRVLELLEGIGKAGSKTNSAASALPLWPNCSEIEDVLSVENACFGQLQRLQREESRVVGLLKSDFQALLREVPADQGEKSHWEFVCKASEALDAVESDYKMKECVVDKLVTHWQTSEEEATFVYKQLLSLRPFLNSEAFDQVEVALEALLEINEEGQIDRSVDRR